MTREQAYSVVQNALNAHPGYYAGNNPDGFINDVLDAIDLPSNPSFNTAYNAVWTCLQDAGENWSLWAQGVDGEVETSKWVTNVVGVILGGPS